MQQRDGRPTAIATASRGREEPQAVQRSLVPGARLWLHSLGVSLLIIGGFVLLQLAELFFHGGRPRGGLAVRNASEMAMRVAGMGHYAVATLFLMTSARTKTVTGAWSVAGLLLGGIALSVLYAEVGGRRNPLALTGFVLLFLAHSLHDRCALLPCVRPRVRSHRPRRAADAALDAGRRHRCSWARSSCRRTWSSRWAGSRRSVSGRTRGTASCSGGWCRPAGPRSRWPSRSRCRSRSRSPTRSRAWPARGRRRSDHTAPWRWSLPVVSLLTLLSAVLGVWIVDLVILMHFVSWFLVHAAPAAAGRHARQLAARDRRLRPVGAPHASRVLDRFTSAPRSSCWRSSSWTTTCCGASR